MAKKRKTRSQKKKRKKRFTVSEALTKKSVLRQAVNWPVHECLISKEWRDTKQVTQVVVTRSSPTGYLAVAGFLIDLGCLGIKDALTIGFNSAVSYRQEYRSSLTASQEMVACDLDLAAKVVNEARNYAAELGFKPHRDSKDALKLLAGANPENCSEQVPLGGEDGKPFYFAGPYDDSDRVMRILDRSVGPGNYTFIVFMDDDPFGDFEDEDFDLNDFDDE